MRAGTRTPRLRGHRSATLLGAGFESNLDPPLVPGDGGEHDGDSYGQTGGEGRGEEGPQPLAQQRIFRPHRPGRRTNNTQRETECYPSPDSHEQPPFEPVQEAALST